MKTNLQQPKQDEGAQLRPEHTQCRKWNVIMDGEIIGSVHGQTKQQAQDTIRILRMPNLSIQPAD